VLGRSLNTMAGSLEDSRAQLSASRARIVAAADHARRRIERDLHDGTQQRLVSLVLDLRAAEGAAPADLPELRAQLARIADGLTGALDDLASSRYGRAPASRQRSLPLGGGQAAGIGFAIRRNTVRDVATQLITSGKVTNSHRAYLGVEVAATTSGTLVITQVQPGGPAARAGLPAGDLITAVDGTPAPDQNALAGVLAGLTPGQTVPVTTTGSDGASRTVRVTLGQYPG